MARLILFFIIFWIALGSWQHPGLAAFRSFVQEESCFIERDRIRYAENLNMGICRLTKGYGVSLQEKDVVKASYAINIRPVTSPDAIDRIREIKRILLPGKCLPIITGSIKGRAPPAV